MSTKKTLVACAVIVAVAALVLTLILTTEPEAQRSGASKQTAMLVDVVEVRRGDFRPTVTAMGTVRPAREVVLSPRVGGRVVERAAAFTPGGFVGRGEVLVRIDPADYRNALARAESDLRQARSDLNLEMGRQQVAEQDYELLRDTVEPGNEDLVLRQPQLEAARSRVEAAQAAVEQAELNLGRTTVRAPFDAHVLSRQADLGSEVAAGAPLGRLVGTDEYWVEVAVPLSKLRFIPFGDGGDGGDGNNGTGAATVEVRNRAAWPG